jgi:hypothetical protein
MKRSITPAVLRWNLLYSLAASLPRPWMIRACASSCSELRVWWFAVSVQAASNAAWQTQAGELTNMVEGVVENGVPS